MRNHMAFVSKDREAAERGPTDRRPGRDNGGVHAPLATGMARNGVFTAGSLISLQRTIGNDAVQRLVTVQRREKPEGAGQEEDETDSGTGLVLTEEDFSPELEDELSGQFRMVEGGEGEEARGESDTNASSWYNRRRAERARHDEEMQAQGRYWSKSRGKYRHKRTPKWMAKRVGAHARGFVRGTRNAYKKGGLHSILSERMASLGRAEKLMKQGKFDDARPLIYRKPVLREASPGKIAKLAAVAPIIMARMAAEDARAKRLRKRWEKHMGNAY